MSRSFAARRPSCSMVAPWTSWCLRPDADADADAVSRQPTARRRSGLDAPHSHKRDTLSSCALRLNNAREGRRRPPGGRRAHAAGVATPTPVDIARSEDVTTEHLGGAARSELAAVQTACLKDILAARVEPWTAGREALLERTRASEMGRRRERVPRRLRRPTRSATP
jgi:hypothetical protein